MRKKKYFLGAAALLALTACSNDETVDLNQDGNVISFAVTANNPSRAAANEVFNNNALPTDFQVWAAYDHDNYFSAETYTKQTSGSYTSSQTHYWPNDGKVTFLALRNQSGTLDWTPAGLTDIAKLTGFTVAGTAEETVEGKNYYTASKQTDFIYALTSKGKPTDGTPGQVGLNFRHALAQVVFKAKVTNPNLYVEIEGVSVCNAWSKADLTFPYANVTDDNFLKPNEDDVPTAPTNPFLQATWDNLQDQTDYTLTFPSVSVANSDGVVNLTAKGAARQTDRYTLLLLPQNTNAWAVTGGSVQPNPALQDGAYFLVKCKIRNVANGTVSNVYLWGSDGEDGAKDVAVPASFNWQQGKKYIITFEFGNGNGGYNPEPSTPTPDPVLVPISFTVSVDDFAKGDDQTVPMN